MTQHQKTPPANPQSMQSHRPAMGESARLMHYDANKKSTLVAYLLWWFLCMLGAHRFYLGRAGSGAAILSITLVSIALMFFLIGFLTILISAIWVFVDAFLIPGMVRDYNSRLANQLSH